MLGFIAGFVCGVAAVILTVAAVAVYAVIALFGRSARDYLQW